MARKKDVDFIGCWYPKGMIEKLDQAAEDKMSSRSQVLREALKHWFG